jgi:hypothetical protein
VRRGLLAVAAAAALAAFVLVQGAGARPNGRSAAAAPTGCQLKSARSTIKHVIYIQFDNTHFRRDNPNVPSDLEQMPNLLDFITGNGTLLTNDHTVLISHTAGGILSSLTGVYPDRHGQIVSNSNVRYNGSGFSFASSFGYWTDPIVSGGPANMVTPTGQNAPAPWVPYTTAGCDVGEVATANTVLENVGTGPSGDMTKVFHTGSPQWNEAEAARLLPNTAANARAKAKPQADFVGFAIHCALTSTLCANGQDDVLPDEPIGYSNYKGLFGAQEINPLLGGSTLTDLDGNTIADPFGNPGFPGFDGMSAAVSLAYVEKMQVDAHVPVTFAYISDAHDFHGVSGNQHVAFGPGSPGYVQQLAAYNDAFGTFFKDLAANGIDKSNTLFVFTVDEGDHFVGVQKTGCDGVTVPCVYGTNEVGEINANIDTLIHHQFPSVPINFTVHGDDAPTVYVSGNPTNPLDAGVRTLENAFVHLTAHNPYTGATDTLMKAVASPNEMRALHMWTDGDPLRDPTFAYFADPNYFLTDFPASTCETCINPLFAWNHGDIQDEIANTWLGFVGPGVQHEGETGAVWSDHTDVQPTMLTLLGLRDDYVPDGRVLLQPLYDWAVPQTLRAHRETLLRLGDVYKQLNAPFGEFGQDTLKISTRAISGSDSTYAATEAQIGTWTAARNTLASAIRGALDAAAFEGKPLDEQQAKGWIDQAQSLIDTVHASAGS